MHKNDEMTSAKIQKMLDKTWNFCEFTNGKEIKKAARFDSAADRLFKICEITLHFLDIML